MSDLEVPVFLGIDFGTSNSAASINLEGGVRLIDVDPYNSSNSKVLISVIYYDDEERRFFVGQEAIDMYIENDAWGRYIQSVKSFLSDDSFISTEIGRRNYTLDDLIGIILRRIKGTGEELLGQQIENVVLGRPVIFSEEAKANQLAKERLLSAAQKVGFKNIHLQYEPIAAALAYESTLGQGEEKVVLVGDFGGGTSDFTVIKVEGGGQKKGIDRKTDILSLGGVPIGGDIFDSQIMWEKLAKHFGKDVRVRAVMGDFDLGISPIITNQLRKWHLIPQLRAPAMRQRIREIKHLADKPDLIENLERLVDYNYGYMLFQAIEKAKCELSLRSEIEIIFDGIGLVMKEYIARSEFERMISEEVSQIAMCVDSTLSEAGLSPEGIDVVFLTGGSSFIPCIRRVFEKKFGQKRIKQTDAFTSVAYGLGLTSFYM